MNNKNFKIVAQRGTDEYLLLMPNKKVRVLAKTYFSAPQNYYTVLRQGYWEDFTGKKSDVAKIYREYLKNKED